MSSEQSAKTGLTSETETILPLTDIRQGGTVRIVSIDAGHGLKNRLTAMGLLTNTTVYVVRNDGAGRIIAGVKNSKIILGRGMAHKIFVSSV